MASELVSVTAVAVPKAGPLDAPEFDHLPKEFKGKLIILIKSGMFKDVSDIHKAVAKIMIGASLGIDAAESLAQNWPSGLEYSEMKKLSGAAYLFVRFRVQNASFQARMMLRRQVEAMPGSAIGANTLLSSGKTHMMVLLPQQLT